MTQKRLGISVGVCLAIVLLLAWRWNARGPTQADDQNHPLASAETIAAVARAERHTVGNTLNIAGEFKPFQAVDVHAKVAGYIKVIHVDVGDHVKTGQTLAVLEIPELAAELAGADASVRRSKEEIRRAEGDLARARSAHAAAHSAYIRLKQAAEARTGLVAQQEIDDSQAKDLESEAQVSGSSAALSATQQQLQVAEANQKQYAALSDYSRIVAPFSGVVTARYADTGALIAAGTSSSTQSMPVVRLAEISKLRLVLPIPESVAAQIHLGDPVNARVQALNQDFVGKVSRFADSLDRQTRTMETEIDFDNRDGHLIPGMYAETRLSLREKKDALAIPLEAVMRNGEDATVLAVNSQNIIEERHVKLGLEDSARVEVLSGLTDKERVVIGNRSQFRSGQKIQPKEVGADASKTGREN
ncbi:MAG TPA: efflux RND transporter periplasmic adaptor subunit [Candidatus Polarisedimenticolia bacterium]|nr:efflux RND transporter periplasmic adaptor subunit [Candidatus Polarisedimenticolia bacterium]